MTAFADRVTVVMVARNAAATIARALRSVLAEPAHAILIIDDASDDDTIDRVRAIRDRRVQLVILNQHSTVGRARQSALELVTTPFGIWLDADDELLPGRVLRLQSAMQREDADFAVDAAELVAGDAAPRVVPLPGFLRRPPGLVRLFERNYLPAAGPVGFRTETLLGLGYDPALHGAEDVDVLLRAVAASCRVALTPEVGYRIHAVPQSLSRHTSRQRAMYRAVLSKFSDHTIRHLWRQAGGSETSLNWGLHSVALFKGDFDAARRHLAALEPLTADPHAVAEPDGPCSRPEGWRLAFARGTLALLAGNPAGACTQFALAEHFGPAAEVANNLGVAFAMRGEWSRARDGFTLAQARLPGYVDPAANLARQAPPWAITTHPLREQANRTDYPVPEALAG